MTATIVEFNNETYKFDAHYINLGFELITEEKEFGREHRIISGEKSFVVRERFQNKIFKTDLAHQKKDKKNKWKGKDINHNKYYGLHHSDDPLEIKLTLLCSNDDKIPLFKLSKQKFGSK